MPDDPIDGEPIDGDPIEGDPIDGDPLGDPIDGDPMDGPIDGDPMDGPVDGDPLGDPIDGDPLGDPIDGDPMDGPTGGDADLGPDADAAAAPSDEPSPERESLPDELTGTTAPAGGEPPPPATAFGDADADPSLDDAATAEPAATAAAVPDADADAAILAELSSIVGSDAEALYAFGCGAGETAIVGLESVANQRTAFGSVVASIAQFSELASDYAGVPHVGLELRVALDEAEVYSVALVVRLEDLGTLLSIEMSPEQMADEELAHRSRSCPDPCASSSISPGCCCSATSWRAPR